MVVEWVLASATVILALATLTLAWFARALFGATRELTRIEEERDRAAQQRRRRRRQEEKLGLAEMVVGIPWETIEISVAKADLGPESDWIRDLAKLLDYEHDQVLQEDVNYLLLTFVNISRGADYGESALRTIKQSFERMQDLLVRDIPGWRNDLLGTPRQKG